MKTEKWTYSYDRYDYKFEIRDEDENLIVTTISAGETDEYYAKLICKTKDMEVMLHDLLSVSSLEEKYKKQIRKTLK